MKYSIDYPVNELLKHNMLDIWRYFEKTKIKSLTDALILSIKKWLIISALEDKPVFGVFLFARNTYTSGLCRYCINLNGGNFMSLREICRYCPLYDEWDKDYNCFETYAKWAKDEVTALEVWHRLAKLYECEFVSKFGGE